jgi:hypothetical protein
MGGIMKKFICILSLLFFGFSSNLNNIIVDHTGTLQNYLNNPIVEDASIYNDNFNDNTLSDLWTVYECNTGVGTVSETTNQLVLTADGGDVWTSSDQYTVAYFTYVGNFDFSVKVGAITNGATWTKYGLMTKNNMEAPASSIGYAMMCDTNSNGFAFQSDNTENGYLDTGVENDSSGTPSWVRLKKVGTTITGYYSPDNIYWTFLGSYTDAGINATADVGIFLCDNGGSGTSSIIFDDFVDLLETPPVDPADIDYTQLDSCDWAFLMNSTSLTDETGNYTVTVGAGVTSVSGIYGNALDFNNSTTGIITFNSTYNPPQQGTIVFWVISDGISGTYDRIIGAHNVFEVRLTKSSAYTIGNDLFSSGQASTTQLSTSNIYHIAATWDYTTGDMNIYINGSLSIWSDNTANTDPGTSITMIIGNRTGTTDYFDGKLDEMAEFNEVLALAQINQIRVKGLKGDQ